MVFYLSKVKYGFYSIVKDGSATIVEYDCLANWVILFISIIFNIFGAPYLRISVVRFLILGVASKVLQGNSALLYIDMFNCFSFIVFLGDRNYENEKPKIINSLTPQEIQEFSQ